jgi:4Fe-4S iron-sulfur cluster binding domain/DR2241 stabilising domain
MITDDLGSLIQQGYNSIGELEFVAAPPGFRLFHTENKNSLGGARVFRRLTDARELAKYDRIGKYRPLKGAPNLPSDWVLELPDLDSLKEALNLFYPGAVGTLLAYRRGETKDIPFRETVNRQTGMYQITRKITTTEAEELVRSHCKSEGNCLRTILWKVEPNQSGNFLPDSKSDPEFDQTRRGRRALPFLCLEACNLTVAAARVVVKNRSK